MTNGQLVSTCWVLPSFARVQQTDRGVIGDSQKTARNHVERTYAKIGVSNRIGASMYALRNGLVNNTWSSLGEVEANDLYANVPVRRPLRP